MRASLAARRVCILFGAWMLCLLAIVPAGARAVVGGSSVPITSFPFQVALYDPSAASVYEGQFCGGVILDATHVATAAHCVFDSTTGHAIAPSSVAVLAGTEHLNEAGEPPYPSSVEQDPALSVSFDPAYEPQENENDAAVLTLSRPLYEGSPVPDGTTTIAPIPIVSPEQAETVANPNRVPAPAVTISGFGDTRREDAGYPADPEYPQELRAAQTHLVSEGTCALEYRWLNPITPGMICAGEPEGGVDACYGDSGGPLVVDTAEPADAPDDYALVGLTDFAEGCALPGYAGVYVRVSEPLIRGFLESLPPPAPAAVATPALTGSPAAGSSLTCSDAGPPAGTTLEYRFFATVGGEAVPLDEPSSGGAYQLTAADADMSIFCRAQASDAGGYSYSDSQPISVQPTGSQPQPEEQPQPPAQPPGQGSAPASPDSSATAPPTALVGGSAPQGTGAGGRRVEIILISRRCHDGGCTLLVDIDSGGKDALRAQLRPVCAPHARHCPRRISGRVAVAHRAGERFSLRVTGLSDGAPRAALLISVTVAHGKAPVRRTVRLPL